MKKILSWIGYTILALIIIAAIIFEMMQPPFKLAYPVASIKADQQTFEMQPASLQWINETSESVVEITDIRLFVKNGDNIPVIEVAPGEELQLTLDYRDEEHGLYKNGEIDAEVHTDAFFFSETDLFERTFYELSLDDANYSFYAPDESGEYALEVEFKVEEGAEEEQSAQYAAKLIVK